MYNLAVPSKGQSPPSVTLIDRGSHCGETSLEIGRDSPVFQVTNVLLEDGVQDDLVVDV
jgi:hypothetical protein